MANFDLLSVPFSIYRRQLRMDRAWKHTIPDASVSMWVLFVEQPLCKFCWGNLRVCIDFWQMNKSLETRLCIDQNLPVGQPCSHLLTLFFKVVQQNWRWLFAHSRGIWVIWVCGRLKYMQVKNKKSKYVFWQIFGSMPHIVRVLENTVVLSCKYV